MSRLLFTIRQAVNLPAVLAVGKVLTHPSKLCPKGRVVKLDETDIEALQKLGIRAVLFDKDNTLTLPYCNEWYDERTKQFVSKCTKMFPGKVAILSNSVGSSDDSSFLLAAETERSLGVPVVRHGRKKPECVDKVIEFLGGGIKMNEICIVGDRLFTDVLFGNNYGMYTILVDPLHSASDPIVPRIMRGIELNVVLPLIDRF